MKHSVDCAAARNYLGGISENQNNQTLQDVQISNQITTVNK